MRITNNIIVKNSKYNINNNKVSVDKYNTQMSTQKKIARASEDPVVAIRSLRLADSLSEVNQYYEKNIPDAESWMSVTETALSNMKDILTDMYRQCVNGATDTLTADDREAIVTSLQALSEQFYAEGNTDYAGRTVFTGYKTNQDLTFTEDDSNDIYELTEVFSYTDIEAQQYFGNEVSISDVTTDVANGSTATIAMPTSDTFQRIRLSYGAYNDDQLLTTSSALTYKYLDASGNEYSGSYAVTSTTREEWEANGYTLADGAVLFLADTGELILGSDVSDTMNQVEAYDISITYTKKGFEQGELRPENYFDCTKTEVTPEGEELAPITYTLEDQDINYTVASNQTITVNTQAHDVFDASVARDIEELAEAVNKAQAASDKITQIEQMIAQTTDEDEISRLNSWLEAAHKESDYYEDYVQSKFSSAVGDFTDYLASVNLAVTDCGSRSQRLELTKTRMNAQQETIEELKSQNEDRDISDIIIDYTAAYNAYTASLTAASKINQQSLLDYIR
ncbi:flagellar hook-associated protein FlgL [Eubacterium oxidoreducens]|uniref:Flagellar hook-associated protein 3 FlgL n=1 Tax=Eubacterium oxidoreducens TaxID=1732 RepID=A0A1G6BRS7_EUBOX|nr:flagellar hook-associated protein FlgL [Eubacterium oxidoreducens]SDB23318.1 flagellar hook-associated protein 3 FlgL [Eubacterium oxidoreducens]